MAGGEMEYTLTTDDETVPGALILLSWPKYEDGSPVMPGCVTEDAGRVCRISFTKRGFYFNSSHRKGLKRYRYGERVKRPAPKVLDADGVEVRVGDTVYHVKDGSEMTVYGIEGEWLVVSVGGHVRHDIVTHRAPVIAADGRPLREGETVYLTDSPTAFVVDDIMTREDGATVVHLKDGAWNLPQYLSHERPDSWERLEEDVAGASCPDVYCANHHIDANDTSYEWAMARDIVRRAKALAGGAK